MEIRPLKIIKTVRELRLVWPRLGDSYQMIIRLSCVENQSCVKLSDKCCNEGRETQQGSLKLRIETEAFSLRGLKQAAKRLGAHDRWSWLGTTVSAFRHTLTKSMLATV